MEATIMFPLALLLAAGAGAPLPIPGRSVIASQFGVAASSQPLAAEAAVQILQRGGNAMDAAIAANSTQGLMEPTGNGIGGDLYALVYVAKEDKLYGLNASGWSPKAMTVEFLKSKGVTGKLPQRGVYSVTVPGVVAGWEALRARFGKLPLSTTPARSWRSPQRTGPGGWSSSRRSQTRARRSSSVDSARHARARSSRTRIWRDRFAASRKKVATATTRARPRKPSWTSCTRRAAR